MSGSVQFVHIRDGGWKSAGGRHIEFGARRFLPGMRSRNRPVWGFLGRKGGAKKFFWKIFIFSSNLST
jgi:hypothetical protein